MSTGYQITDQDGLYFMTFQIVGWVDIFSRQVYRDIAIDSFKYCQEHKGFELFAYVIMSNHIHLVARSKSRDLSGTVRDYKNFTCKRFLDELLSDKESRRIWMQMVFEYHAKYKEKQNNQVWTHENHSELIYSQKFIEQKIEYIHNNPVRAGIVEEPEDYLYSSARNYAGLDNVLEVLKVDFLWKGV